MSFLKRDRKIKNERKNGKETQSPAFCYMLFISPRSHNFLIMCKMANAKLLLILPFGVGGFFLLGGKGRGIKNFHW